MLLHQGEKKTLIAVGNINKITHSYTAQYSLTLSGKLLPKILICLQEPNDKFGPKIEKEIEKLMHDYKTIYVTCSKSGKLISQKYQLYLDIMYQRHT